MLFRVFESQEERRKFGSSAFIELQYCKALVAEVIHFAKTGKCVSRRARFRVKGQRQ